MPNLNFFDPEDVTRPIPQGRWKLIVLAAIFAAALLVVPWEFYWRSKGFRPGDINNTQGLWAQARQRATGDTTVLIGASRLLFNSDLDIWEEVASDRPVQLAIEGMSPRILLKEFAADASFRGLIIVDVTSNIFWVREGGRQVFFFDYARNETLAQRADQMMMLRLESVFGFIDDQTRPKRQLAIWPLPPRNSQTVRSDPRKLEVMDARRNAEMWDRIVSDQAYREEAKTQWLLSPAFTRHPRNADGTYRAQTPDEVTAIIDTIRGQIEQIRARGGDVAFVQFPFEGPYSDLEAQAFPREAFWNRLLGETNSAGISFLDYPTLQGYNLPEWSHIEARDAERYTHAMVPLLMSEVERKRAERGAR